MKTPLNPDDVERFRDLVRERVGLAFSQSRLSDVERAVRKAVAETGLPDAGALYRLLVNRAQPHESLDALISALNVSETHFFRDRNQIQALEGRILPEIIARRRPERRLRVWSAACSTGEEAYTLAILIRQQLPDLREWDVRILGTDLNGRSLERARRGVYGPWSFRGVSARVKDTYFVREGERYEVSPRIRAMVTFEQVNLINGALPLPSTDPWGLDLILCRNVLLYFGGETARGVVGRLRECLDDQGWLLVSQVEAALGIFDGFELDAQGGGAFRKARPAPAEVGPPADEQSSRRDRSVGPSRRGAGALPTPPDSRRHQPVARLVRVVRQPSRAVPPPARPMVVPPARTSAEESQVPAGYGEALQLWREGRSEDALRRLQVEGARDQLTAPLHYLQGLILLDEGRADQALAAFRRCTFADPSFALGHLAQAGLFARAGKRSRARASLENAARLVADLDPEARIFPGDELRTGALLELVDAQRQLLRSHTEPEVVDG